MESEAAASPGDEVEALRERLADLEVRNARLLDEVGVLRGRAEIDIPHWRSQLCKCSEVLEQYIAPFRGAELGERLAKVLEFQAEIQEGLRGIGGAALREEKEALKASFEQHYRDFEAKRQEFENERVQMLDFKDKMSKKNDMLKKMVGDSEEKNQEWEVRFQQMETYWQEQVQIAYQAGIAEGQRLSQQGITVNGTPGGAEHEPAEASAPTEAAVEGSLADAAKLQAPDEVVPATEPAMALAASSEAACRADAAKLQAPDEVVPATEPAMALAASSEAACRAPEVSDPEVTTATALESTTDLS